MKYAIPKKSPALQRAGPCMEKVENPVKIRTLKKVIELLRLKSKIICKVCKGRLMLLKTI